MTYDFRMLQYFKWKINLGWPKVVFLHKFPGVTLRRNKTNLHWYWCSTCYLLCTFQPSRIPSLTSDRNNALKIECVIELKNCYDNCRSPNKVNTFLIVCNIKYLLYTTAVMTITGHGIIRQNPNRYHSHVISSLYITQMGANKEPNNT